MFVPETFQDRPYARQHFLGIVAGARKENPFYREWIPHPERDVPILDRLNFLENNETILNGNPVSTGTSGSTGIPVRISVGPQRKALNGRNALRNLKWMGGELPTLAIIQTRGADRDDDTQIDIRNPIDEQIAFILRRRQEAGIRALVTYPSNAELLARAVLEEGHDFSFIERITLRSETVENHHRQLIREAFPEVTVTSTYSSEEFGPIALQCPHQPDYHHVVADVLGVEVLDSADRPVGEGETGRLVITDYFNLASPLIRYEIGDLAVRATCPCGQTGLPSLGKIIGKVRGTLVQRDGTRLVFGDLSAALLSLPGMRQYQVIQEELERFVVNVVGPESLNALIPGLFEEQFGYRPDIEIRHLEEIPRGENGKFHASICRI